MDIDERDLQNIISKIDLCKKEIAKGIVGQEELIEEVLISILAGGNILIEGMPGLGKTQLIKTIGKVLDLDFSRIQFTPDLMPADVTGTNLVVKNEGETKFEFERGPVFTNLLLADEINRATPKTQSALLEAMGEKTVTVGGRTYELPDPFMVLATQNPVEQEGTYPLPEAQLDRFSFKLISKFPSLEELGKIMDITVSNEPIVLNKVVDKNELLEMKKMIAEIPMTDAVKDYALRVIVGTHPGELNIDFVDKYVAYGASPRAAQALFRAAKVRALMNGRYNVAFDDIKTLAYPILRHRLILNFDAVTDKVDSEAVINHILNTIQVG